MTTPKDIFFAPLQGFTDAAYRKAHQAICGGVAGYYAPFLRLEHGELRRRVVRDVEPSDVPLVPQVIAAEVDEFRVLTQVLQKILPFWEYAGLAFDHRLVKRLKKSHNLQEYKSLI